MAVNPNGHLPREEAKAMLALSVAQNRGSRFGGIYRLLTVPLDYKYAEKLMFELVEDGKVRREGDSVRHFRYYPV